MTTEELLALADRLSNKAGFMPPMLRYDLITALRQCADWLVRKDLEAQAHYNALQRCRDDATSALKTAQKHHDEFKRLVAEEREREERLLKRNWHPSIRVRNDPRTEVWRWTHGKAYRGEWVEHPDRATAARLAEAKMEGRKQNG